MRGVYTGRVRHAALAAIKNLMVLTCPSTKVIEVLKVMVTDEDNETNQQWSVQVIRASAAGTGAATAIPKKPTEVGDQAAGATLEHTYATTEPTLESDPLDHQGVPSLNGYLWEPDERKYIYVPPSGILVVRMNIAPAATDVLAEITWKEVG